MPPGDPCKGCKCRGLCPTQGLMNRLALEAWVDDTELHSCDDFQPDYYRGIEGVLP